MKITFDDFVKRVDEDNKYTYIPQLGHGFQW